MATTAYDLTGSVVKELIRPQVITADIATNPGVAADMSAATNVNVILHLGTIHADTTGTATIVESDSGSNGTWTTVANAGAAITFTGTSDGTVIVRSVKTTKPYVGILVDLSGATLSCGISAVAVGDKRYV